MPAAVIPVARQQFLDDNGDPVVNGTLKATLAGTATLAALFSDTLLAVPAANPMLLDAGGRMPTGLYTAALSLKWELSDASGVIWTQDNVPAVATAAEQATLAATVASEGTPLPWTPTDASGAGLVLANGGCWYYKRGGQVFLSLNVTYPATASGATALIGGQPFTANASVMGALALGFSSYGSTLTLLMRQGTTVIEPYGPTVARTNANLSGAIIYAAGTYLV